MIRRAILAFTNRTALEASVPASIICCIFQLLLVAFELRFTADRHAGWRTWAKQTWHAVDHAWPALNLDQCGVNLKFDWCPICGAWAEPGELQTRCQRTWQSKREQLTEAIQSPEAALPWKAKGSNRRTGAQAATHFQTRSKDGALSR